MKHRKEKKIPETEIRKKKKGEIGNRNTKPETEKHCLQNPANMKIKGKIGKWLTSHESRRICDVMGSLKPKKPI
jgi:hypothetical protein